MNVHASILVVTAPSGAGKTTLNKRLTQEVGDMEFSVSHTTRKQRFGEKEGEHYYFVDKQEFERMVHQKELLEWAKVHQDLYGTSKNEIHRILKKGHRILFEVDVQGAVQIAQVYPEAQLLFILPPSIQSLKDRLKKRGANTDEETAIRLGKAKMEIEEGKKHFQHFIVNDDLEKAYQELYNFVTLGQPLKLKRGEGKKYCEKLLEEFDRESK